MRWYATAILSAVSTASEPELAKKTWPIPTGASSTIRSASEKIFGCPIWNAGL